jgi:hypothetical protein
MLDNAIAALWFNRILKKGDMDLYERSPVKQDQVILFSIRNDSSVFGVGFKVSRRAELRA